MDNGNRSNSSGSLNGNKQLNRTSLKIGGMTCAACSARVENRLRALSGVTTATVNLAIEKAVVEHDPTIITTADLIREVEA